MPKESKKHSKVPSWFPTRLPKVCITIKLVDGTNKQESPSAPLENPDGSLPFLLRVYFANLLGF